MLVVEGVGLVLGGPCSPLAFSSPFYATGRTVWYFQKEMIVAEEFGNTVISKISAGLSELVVLCCIRGITNTYFIFIFIF